MNDTDKECMSTVESKPYYFRPVYDIHTGVLITEVGQLYVLGHHHFDRYGTLADVDIHYSQESTTYKASVFHPLFKFSLEIPLEKKLKDLYAMVHDRLDRTCAAMSKLEDFGLEHQITVFQLIELLHDEEIVRYL